MVYGPLPPYTPTLPVPDSLVGWWCQIMEVAPPARLITQTPNLTSFIVIRTRTDYLNSVSDWITFTSFLFIANHDKLPWRQKDLLYLSVFVNEKNTLSTFCIYKFIEHMTVDHSCKICWLRPYFNGLRKSGWGAPSSVPGDMWLQVIIYIYV